MAESFPNGWKTLWEKEEWLLLSNFSFFHSVFKRLVLQTRKNQGLSGKGLIVRMVTKKGGAYLTYTGNTYYHTEGK